MNGFWSIWRGKHWYLVEIEDRADPGIEGSIGQKILTAQMESLQIQREVIEMQNLADESYIKMMNIIDEN